MDNITEKLMHSECCDNCKKGDKLEQIIALQKTLMSRLGVESFPVSFRDERQIMREEEHQLAVPIQRQTKDMLFAICCELGEIGDEINWKPWKSKRKNVDLDLLYSELIDVLHFILEICIMWGMNADTIFEYYKAKMEENHARQARGY